MKVIDFSAPEFDIYLSTLPFSSTDKEQILVIAIADGGIPIAERVESYLKSHTTHKTKLETVNCQRPSTKAKKNTELKTALIKMIFKITPKKILDMLRIWEHNRLKLRHPQAMVRTVSEANTKNISINYSLILIVDDAVDSGASMLAVKDHFQKVFSLTHVSPPIKTLAAVVTQENPVFTPDFYWKKNVLIRFPWSLDAN